jgi:ABC-type sugar transport system ATPase subunit
MATIKLEGIHKTFETRHGYFQIKHLNLTIWHGKTTVILGPSGSGKTTLLRIIAGLESPDHGVVRFNGIDMSKILPSDRKIGMVFQEYALYPHMTAAQNIISRFIIGPKTPDSEQIAKEKLLRTSQMLNVKIDYLKGRLPRHLSKGEQQRVALGRAITRDPDLLLLDEPLASLDAKLRVSYRAALKRLIQELKITTVYITHNQQEAAALGDFIVIMNEGRIEQVGTYQAIYDNPQKAFVAGFLSVDGEVPAINLIDGGNFDPSFKNILVGVRPEHIQLSQHPEKTWPLRGRIVHIMHNPARDHTIVELSVGNATVYALVEHQPDLEPGRDAWMCLQNYYEFNKANGKRQVESDEMRQLLLSVKTT